MADVLSHVASSRYSKLVRYKDGVFSNLNAKPEIMRIDDRISPPAYAECIMNMPPPYYDVVDEEDLISSIVIDGTEVGSTTLFALHCLIGIIFHVIGVAAGLFLGQTHASKYGSLSALGVLLLLTSLSLEEERRLSPNIRSFLSVVLFVGGYILFMISLFIFQRIQDRAKEVHRAHYTITGHPHPSI